MLKSPKLEMTGKIGPTKKKHNRPTINDMIKLLGQIQNEMKQRFEQSNGRVEKLESARPSQNESERKNNNY